MPGTWLTKEFVDKVAKLNRERLLNRWAEQALKQLKEPLDSTCLHVLNLLWWALENQKLAFRDQDQRVWLENTVSLMPTWNPESVMEVFERSDDGDELDWESILNLKPEEKPDPVNLAAELVEQLHSRIVASGGY